MTSNAGMTIFIPLYNEEALLVKNTLQLLAFLDGLERPYEVILGSNGSTDGTVDLARGLSETHDRVRFFQLGFQRRGTGLPERGRDGRP